MDAVTAELCPRQAFTFTQAFTVGAKGAIHHDGVGTFHFRCLPHYAGNGGFTKGHGFVTELLSTSDESKNGIFGALGSGREAP